jgi:hypothetical protein
LYILRSVPVLIAIIVRGNSALACKKRKAKKSRDVIQE